MKKGTPRITLRPGPKKEQLYIRKPEETESIASCYLLLLALFVSTIMFLLASR